MNRTATTFALLLLSITTGCQVVVPSAQQAEEVCIGPSPRWAGRLAGMPEFVPRGEATSDPIAPRPKFHSLPTRPVFTPWSVSQSIVEVGEPANPLLDKHDPSAIGGDEEEPIDLPPGFFPDVIRDKEGGPTGSGVEFPGKSASSRNATVRSVSSSRRSRWAEMRVVE